MGLLRKVNPCLFAFELYGNLIIGAGSLFGIIKVAKEYPSASVANSGSPFVAEAVYAAIARCVIAAARCLLWATKELLAPIHRLFLPAREVKRSKFFEKRQCPIIVGQGGRFWAIEATKAPLLSVDSDAGRPLLGVLPIDHPLKTTFATLRSCVVDTLRMGCNTQILATVIKAIAVTMVRDLLAAKWAPKLALEDDAVHIGHGAFPTGGLRPSCIASPSVIPTTLNQVRINIVNQCKPVLRKRYTFSHIAPLSGHLNYFTRYGISGQGACY